ncbi:ester cyclase [Halalkalicoccus ordinarius]|uniref:ester cyclase n=1 Tax=Halalkalicoccus ordinarius TaxID=3116651 RepID=UPI003908302A
MNGMATTLCFTMPPSEEVHGQEGHKSYGHGFRKTFPDLEVTADRIVTEDDTVAVRYPWRGTHRGELVGIEPTGKRVEGTGMVVVRFEDGRCGKTGSSMTRLACSSSSVVSNRPVSNSPFLSAARDRVVHEVGKTPAFREQRKPIASRFIRQTYSTFWFLPSYFDIWQTRPP